MRIREDIAERLLAMGIVPDKEIVTHCQTHHRSGFTYLLAKALGYPASRAMPVPGPNGATCLTPGAAMKGHT